MRQSKILRALVGIGLLAGFGAALAAPAGATGPSSTSSVTNVCSGTDSAPSQLAGTFVANVVVSGVCWVNGGTATIIGNLTVAPGATLNATFALNDQPGATGSSTLDVIGNITVDAGATLVIGCEANYSPCTDDPNAASGGTLSSQDHVWGGIYAEGALGVIVHNSVILGDVDELGGGGGVSCIPPSTGIFAAMQSPVFSDYEDNYIGGDLVIAGLQTCWLGALRDNVQGSVSDIGNTFADPDANEVISNVVHGSMDCFDNSPQVQFGDSGGVPNQVSESALGECGLSALQPNPAANEPSSPGSSPPYYPAGPLGPISVQA
jgi:hypothetical protein